tara:strand:- start:5183 stop:6013 length:831 start_codon:yes stop_codon:yes gene_type:complete
MSFRLTGVNYWKDTFKKLNHFDILPYQDVIDLYLEVNDNLKPDHEKFGENERPINSDKENLKKGEFWDGFPPVYYNIDPTNEKIVMAKADVVSMDMAGLGERWDSFLYLNLPFRLINEYMTCLHDNDDVTIARKFINEVESSPLGWSNENWKLLEKKYDNLYPDKSTYTDAFETHTCIKWKQDFDIRQYISIKQNGLLFPICYNDSMYMLKRGTHRAVLLAMTGSDVPIFLQVPKGKKQYSVKSPPFFNGERLIMEVDLETKKLNFLIGEKNIGNL